MVAYISIAHPDAPAEKFSVSHPSKDEVEVGLLAAILEYAAKHDIDWMEVASTVTWPN